MNAAWVVLAIALPAEENGITLTTVCKLHLPVKKSVSMFKSNYQGKAKETDLYLSFFSDAQYILRVTRRPSLKRSRPVTWHTAQETSPEQSNPPPVLPLQFPPAQWSIL